MTHREMGLCAGAAVLFLAALLCLGVLPGVRFTGCLLAALAAALLGAIPFHRWAKRSQTGKRLWRMCGALLAAGCVLFVVVEGVILFHGTRDHTSQEADAVLVLGAGVNGERPSLILQSRIDAAAAYLKQHPETPAILSGGQGPGEDIAEAEAMRRGLVAQGIAPDRLFLEAHSTSTAENFAYSQDLLEEMGLSPETAELAVVTSNFHCFRAQLIARKSGLSSFELPAKSPWPWLNGNYYVREFFALGKTILFD